MVKSPTFVFRPNADGMMTVVPLYSTLYVGIPLSHATVTAVLPSGLVSEAASAATVAANAAAITM